MALPDSWPKWLRWTINRIDDPWDNFKHWLKGEHHWFNHRVCWKGDAYMANKPGTKFSIKRIDCNGIRD